MHRGKRVDPRGRVSSAVVGPQVEDHELVSAHVVVAADFRSDISPYADERLVRVPIFQDDHNQFAEAVRDSTLNPLLSK